MTERGIQDKLARWLMNLGRDMICPNCGVFGWEADLVAVTNSGYIHEYEIKVSRSDFLADAKKRKHKQIVGDDPRWANYRRKNPPPVCLWYVVPEGLVQPDELPPHAGLLYMCQGYIDQVVDAPRMHKLKASNRQLMYIARGLSARYWKGRKRARA